jgi:periplasmic divalent cation tolerance protein
MTDAATHLILSVTTTVGSLDSARNLAARILAQKLAACVQIDTGVISLYRWEGEQHADTEVRLVIKTLPACEQALRDLLGRHHPYDLPQFLCVTMRASPAYADWVRSEVSLPG